MCRISKFRLELVKEESHNYSFDRKIGGPKDGYEIVKELFNMENQPEEILVMLALDTKNKVLGAFEVSRGTLNSSQVHPREIFKRALLQNAASILIAHNHPSGDAKESKEDVNITIRLKEAGKILGIDLLDHIIIGENSFKSMKEIGIL